MRAQKRPWKEMRAQKHAQKEVRAQRCTQKEVRARKRTKKEIKAQRHTRKKGRVRKHTTQQLMVKHRLINVENNALWLICTYTYLRNICPFFLHGVFLFSKVWVLIANFDGLFALCLLESYFVILTSGKGLISSYFFILQPLSQGSSTLPNILFS